MQQDLNLHGETDLPAAVRKISAEIDFSNKTYSVVFNTNKGEISLELFPDVAPNHCRNLIALARTGFYDGLTFHRVISGFVIQGGCPKGDGSGGPGYTVNAEFNDRPHEEGVLSMARTPDPNSAGSQFFLCLGRVPYLDNQYTVFGQAANEQSVEVIRSIGKMETGANDRPVEDIVIERCTVVES